MYVPVRKFITAEINNVCKTGEIDNTFTFSKSKNVQFLSVSESRNLDDLIHNYFNEKKCFTVPCPLVDKRTVISLQNLLVRNGTPSTLKLVKLKDKFTVH